MSILTKSAIAAALLIAAAAVPAPATQSSLAAPAGVTRVAEAPKGALLATPDAADAGDCFFARKKGVKRRVNGAVRLVKVCQ